MPAVSRLRLQNTPTGIVQPEDMALYLPCSVVDNNSIPTYHAVKVIERRLRQAQANDALDQLRRHLRARSQLYNTKKRDVRGQRYNTRSQTYLKSISDKIAADAARYRAAYAALAALDPKNEHGWQRSLCLLKPEDIRAMTERGLGESEGLRTLSWIWRTSGAPGGGDGRDDSEEDLEGEY